MPESNHNQPEELSADQAQSEDHLQHIREHLRHMEDHIQQMAERLHQLD